MLMLINNPLLLDNLGMIFRRSEQLIEQVEKANF